MIIRVVLALLLLSASVSACPYRASWWDYTVPFGVVSLTSETGSNKAVRASWTGFYQFKDVIACGNLYKLSVRSRFKIEDWYFILWP